MGTIQTHKTSQFAQNDLTWSVVSLDFFQEVKKKEISPKIVHL